MFDLTEAGALGCFLIAMYFFTEDFYRTYIQRSRPEICRKRLSTNLWGCMFMILGWIGVIFL